jgi:NADH-quinone oxidoreductase subunit M
VSVLTDHLLSVLVFLPALGGLFLALPIFSQAHDADGRKAQVYSFAVTIVTFLLSLLLLQSFVPGNGYQFTEQAAWIPSFGVQYLLGVDGISLFLVLLTTFIMPLIMMAAQSVTKHRRGYLLCMLFLQTAMIGTLVALDTFLFYVFWELMLAPMYFIIGIWGGKRRIYATLKFVLYTVVGSVLMLVALLYVVAAHYEQMLQVDPSNAAITFALSALLETNLSLKEELWLFAAFILAFGIKVPLFPFHTWLPDAHVEAPTGGSVVLAGVLLKMGLYGFIRFAYPLFPNAAAILSPYIAVLAVIGIVYGALVAWAQHDIKKLVAYSSVSHLGYCVLGVVAFNVMSTTGSIFQMLSHGITTGALFLLVGVLYDRKHTREIAAYGGLAAKVPVFAFLFLAFTLGSIALPLTNGFVGEFLILLGSFQTFQTLTGIAVLGVVLGAVYMLTLYLRTMYGPLNEEKNGDLTDVTALEFATFVPLLVLMFVMGVYPQPFIERMQPAVESYITQVNERGAALRTARKNPLGAQDAQRQLLQAAPDSAVLGVVATASESAKKLKTTVSKESDSNSKQSGTVYQAEVGV